MTVTPSTVDVTVLQASLETSFLLATLLISLALATPASVQKTRQAMAWLQLANAIPVTTAKLNQQVIPPRNNITVGPAVLVLHVQRVSTAQIALDTMLEYAPFA